MSRFRAFVYSAPKFGLVAGPLLCMLVYYWVPEQTVGPDGSMLILGTPGKVTAGLAFWMAVWWLTEAIPVYATALLPIAVLPLTGARTIELTASSYAHPIIYLFLGGFILALGLERWHLHRRFALFILRIVGTGPRRIVGGFMFASAALSMWITNTATTLVMLPIALSIIAMESDRSPHKQTFALCLLLGIAYSASIGGLGTIVGTVPNMFTVSFMDKQLGHQVSFTTWMQMGVPIVLVFVPIAWLLLTRFILPLPPHSDSTEFDMDTRPDPWNRGAVLTLVIFLLTAFSWIARPLLVKLPLLTHLTDAGIAIIAAMLLFAIPENLRERRFLMDWETALRVPWGVLILLGGGLALANAISANGVGELLAAQLATVGEVPPLVMTLLVVTLIIFLTELTSNTATTTALIPIFSAMAVGLGIEPLLVILPATLAASCAFMLPVATPPNAIVFGSGMIRIPQMARVGFWLNITGIMIITILAYLLVPLLLN